MVRKLGLPNPGDYVIVTVRRITPNAAWCELDEYPTAEGMIHVSEVAGKWVRDIRKFVKLNKTYVAKVLYVDRKNNFVKLSLKRVDRIEKKRKLEEFKLEQRAERMLEVAAKKLKRTLDQAYEEIGYELQKQFGSLHDAFDEILETGRIEGIPKKWNETLYEVVSKSVVEKERRLIAELTLKATKGDGIESIRSVLISLKKQGFNVKYISAPRYRVELKTKDPKSGEKRLLSALRRVVESFPGEAGYKMVT